MDESTDGVSLPSGFVFDVLAEFEHRRTLCHVAFEKAAHLDASMPEVHVDIALYNEICMWLEQNLGPTNVKRAGFAIGHRVVDRIEADGQLKDRTPLGMMQALIWAAENMVKDSRGRGFVVLESNPHSIRLRRTQTFNCILQEGLVRSMIERTGRRRVRVKQRQCTQRGHRFCEYEITWRDAPASIPT